MQCPINYQDFRLQSKQSRQECIIEDTTCYNTLVNASEILLFWIKCSFTRILGSLTQILSWCASAAVKDFSGRLCETD